MARSNNFQVRVTGDTTKFDAAMNKANRELRSFGDAAKSAFAIVGVTSFTAALGSLARTIGDFERANSELAAVLGTNLKGVERLTESAKQLGRTSEFTASDVTKLQIALSRLGFNTGQIEQMQGSVLNFALAMNTDLASAADFTGSALRAFGLEAKDTTALLDVMSASTTNSALDFSKLQTSISVVAPIAKSFGLDVKETAAFLGVLANNGFDASSAATALRNILLNLADDGGKLAEGIGHSAHSFEEIIASFKELQARGVDVAQVLEMTDKRSAAAAATIITQAEAVADLKGKLDDAGGSLQTMADTMGDNLNGSVKGLQSAWEGLILSLEASKGPMKDVVDALTKIVNRMTDIISKQDKITFWEAALGPISGGLIASRLRNNSGGIGYAGGGSGGGSRGVSEAVSSAADAAVDATQKAAETAAKKTAEAAAKKLREELKKMAEAKDKWSWLGGVSASEGSPAFPGVITPNLMPNLDQRTIYEFQKSFSAQLGDVTVGIEFKYDKDKITDISNEVTSLLQSGVASAAGLIGELVGTLAGGGDAWGNFKNAALSAFGDMAIAVGKIAISTGLASEGIKAALKLDPKFAIVAGAALVALGTAVKAGLSAASSGDYSASSGGVSTSSYSSGTGDYETREVNVNVTGTLVADGDQLVTVINNANKKKYYTT